MQLTATLVLPLAASQELGLSPAATQPVPFARVYAADTPGLVPPSAITAPLPHLTTEAARARVQGTLLLEVTVGSDGRVRDAMVTKSLDARYGFDERAVATVAEWVFEPGKLDGRAVPVRTIVTITNTFR